MLNLPSLLFKYYSAIPTHIATHTLLTVLFLYYITFTSMIWVADDLHLALLSPLCMLVVCYPYFV